MDFSRPFSAASACLLCGIALAALPTRAAAQAFIGFENLASAPASDSVSSSFSAANGGSDTVDGVTFDDNFLVFGASYSAGQGGNDVYGAPDGTYAITNGDGSGGTGPYPTALDGLMITTDQVLQSAYFGQNDYGDGSDGADQITVTAVGASGDLASVSLALTSTALSELNTASAFDPYAGQITGYRLDYELDPNYAALGAGGGNYVADDFTFASSSVTPTPEASSCLPLGILLLAGAGAAFRKRARAAR